MVLQTNASDQVELLRQMAGHGLPVEMVEFGNDSRRPSTVILLIPPSSPVLKHLLKGEGGAAK